VLQLCHFKGFQCTSKIPKNSKKFTKNQKKSGNIFTLKIFFQNFFFPQKIHFDQKSVFHKIKTSKIIFQKKIKKNF